MFGRWKQNSERVQIDADWLLGETSGPATSRKGDAKPRGGVLSTLVLLSLVATAVSLWPVASKSWLRWEWSKQLVQSTNKSSEDVLPILLALNDLSPDHSIALVSQLASEDVDKRLVAYHLLQKRIERWENGPRPNPSELTAFTNSLDTMPLGNLDSIMLRAQIAARVLRFTGRDTNNSSKLRTTLDQMIAAAASKADETLVDRPALSLSKQTSIAETGLVRARISDMSRLTESEVPKITVPEVASSPVAPRIAAKEIGAFESSNASVPLNTVPLNTMKIPVQPQPTVPVIAETRSTPVNWRAPSVPPPLLETSQKFDTAPLTAENVEPPIAIQGIEKRPLEDILRLLASAQPKIAVSASNELLRRGMTNQQLEIAVALAQGDVQARSEAMDQLVRDANFDTVPWLVWMAEQADPKVRRKAIAMLGSMSSTEAMRKLRLLKIRESDSSIADQINQVLLATGTPSSNFR